jgi:hypothetical protein
MRYAELSVSRLRVNTINGQAYPNMPGMGNVYYVQNTSDTAAHADLLRRYGGVYYGSGEKVLFPCTAASADVAIQAALDACVANRNDYVFVMPSASTYTLTAALTMSKKNVHLIAQGGLGRSNGANNSTRVQAAAASYWVNVSAASCEIAGFYIKNYTALTAIYLGGSSTAVAPNIHHNTFFTTLATGANAAIILGAGDGGWYGSICDNFFMTYGVTGSPVLAAYVSLTGAAGMADISHNRMVACKCVVTKGIDYVGVGGSVNDNDIFGADDYAGSGAGTYTVAIAIGNATNAFGNRLGVVNSADLSGGGTYSYLDNLSHSSGGALAA